MDLLLSQIDPRTRTILTGFCTCKGCLCLTLVLMKSCEIGTLLDLIAQVCSVLFYSCHVDLLFHLLTPSC